MFTILTDTSANLDCALLRELRIGVIPFTFTVEGAEQSCTDTAAFDGSWDAFRGEGGITMGAAQNAVGLPTATWSLKNWSVAEAPTAAS